MDNESIEIYYANVKLSKKVRTINLVNEIGKFNPSVILTNSDISVASRIFYNKVPIVYMSMGGDYFSNLADAYLCIMKERVIESNNKYGLLDIGNLYEFKYGLKFVRPKKNIQRKDYNIAQNDFVMVTVGNRLDAEMDEEFIDYIAKFIIENDDVKWLIVGGRNISYIQDRYQDLIGNKIVRIQYEDDLPALYRICDIYLNPRRKGGGISIAMAMNEGLPIVLTRDSTDGVYYVGMENVVGRNMEEYIELVNSIKNNPELKSNLKTSMYRNISNFSIQKSINNLTNIFLKL